MDMTNELLMASCLIWPHAQTDCNQHTCSAILFCTMIVCYLHTQKATKITVANRDWDGGVKSTQTRLVGIDKMHYFQATGFL